MSGEYNILPLKRFLLGEDFLLGADTKEGTFFVCSEYFLSLNINLIFFKHNSKNWVYMANKLNLNSLLYFPIILGSATSTENYTSRLHGLMPLFGDIAW